MINYADSLFYLPALFLSSIGLFVSFIAMLIVSSCSIVSRTENFILDRYTAITRRIHLPKHRTPKQFTPSICFMGGGQLWMFAIGVGHFVYENYDISKIKFLASSSGCFAAVPLACGLDPYEWCKCDWGKCIRHFESRGILGCLYDTKHFYYQLWDDYLPPDAHIICTGRLFVSVTLFPSMKNKVVSEFNTRSELIWVIIASMCLPFAFIRDFPVMCNSEVGYALDGGFSNDSPCLDSYTITASALHREADIKPIMNPKKRKSTSFWIRHKLGSMISSKNNTSVDSSDQEETDNDSLTNTEESSRLTGDMKSNLISPINAIDIIQVPQYDRVWQIATLGMMSSAKCADFERHEWESIRLQKDQDQDQEDLTEVN